LSQPSCIVAAARRALTDDATTRIPDQNNLPPQNPADMMPSGQFSLNQPEVQAPIEEDEALKALENARALEKLNMIAYGLQPTTSRRRVTSTERLSCRWRMARISSIGTTPSSLYSQG